MSGDLSITVQPTRRDLAGRPGASGLPLPSPGTQGGHRPPADVPGPGHGGAAAEEVEAARLRSLLTDPAMRVSTHHDEASGRTVLEVQSRTTGELVEQIPSESLLRLYAMLREPLVDERA